MFTSLQIAIHGAGAASRSVVGRGAAGTSQPAGSALGSEWKAERSLPGRPLAPGPNPSAFQPLYSSLQSTGNGGRRRPYATTAGAGRNPNPGAGGKRRDNGSSGAPQPRTPGQARSYASAAPPAAPGGAAVGGLGGLGALAGLKLTAPPPPKSFSDFDWNGLPAGAILEVSPSSSSPRLVQLKAREPGSATRDATDASGASLRVAPSDVEFVLEEGPEGAAAGVAAVAAAAAALMSAREEGAALAAMWEKALETPAAALSLDDIASLAFPSLAPSSQTESDKPSKSDKLAARYAAYRLIKADAGVRITRAKRRPPTFRPRPKDQVETLLRRREEEELETGVMAPLEAACREVLGGGGRKDRGWWEAAEGGAVAPVLKSLEDYARERPQESDPAPRGRALNLLARLGRVRSPNAAAALLSALGWWPQHPELALLRSPTCRDAFPPEVEAAAAAVAAGPPADPDARTRRDLTHLITYTIDDASTKEIDDGLSASLESDNRIRIWIHVADPSAYIRLGDALDLEARMRARTLYLPTRTVPMFPKVLAEGPFSLRNGVPSLSFTVEVLIGPGGEVLESTAYPSTVLPNRKLTYEEADEVLVLKIEEESALLALEEASLRRRKYRDARGAINIDLPECIVDVTREEGEGAEGVSVALSANWQQRSDSRQLVAEMMILAGEAVGVLGGRAGLPLPYRGQAIAARPQDDEDLQKIPEGPARAALLRRRMTRSTLQAAAPQRHDGLGLEAYVQVTSPIRRYGDLLAHFQLKGALRGEGGVPMDAREMNQIVDQSSLAAREAGRVEGEVTAYWVAYYFSQQDPRRIYRATLMSWGRTDRGLASVLLTDLGLESQARLFRAASPGDAVSVKVGFVDVQGGVVRLEECGAGEVEAWEAVGGAAAAGEGREAQA